MKYILSPIANEINGPIGGLTFCKHPKSPYARGNPITRVDPTSSQTAVRSAYGALSGFWQSLPPIIKTAWNDFAVPYKISGFNYFIEENMPRLLGSLPPNLTSQDSVPSAPLNAGLFDEAYLDWYAMGWLNETPWANPTIWGFFNNPLDTAFSEYTFTLSDTVGTDLTPGYFANYIEWYTMDADNPTAEKPYWPDMTSVDPGGISQGTWPDGIKYNSYDGVDAVNTVVYGSSYWPKYDQQFTLGFHFVIPSTAPTYSNTRLFDSDPFLAMDINWSTGEMNVICKRSGADLIIPTGPFIRDQRHHIAVQNDIASGNVLVFWDGVIQSVTPLGAMSPEAGTNPMTFAGWNNSYRECLCSIGNPFFHGLIGKPWMTYWEWIARNVNYRVKRVNALDIDPDASGYVIRSDSSKDILSKTSPCIVGDMYP